MEPKDQAAIRMEAAVGRAEKVIEKFGAKFDARLRSHLQKLQEAIEADDRTTAMIISHGIKGQAGMFGWPLISEVAGWLRQLLEAEEGSCRSEPVRLHMDSLWVLANGDLRGEHPRGRHLVRELYALVERQGIRPA